MTNTNSNYTASTILNYSPQKTRLIINEIRGQALDQAILTLKSMQKPKAKKIYQLLKSGASNLKLVEGDYSQYAIISIVAEEAQRLYRSMPRARGSAFKIRRRYARIRVELAMHNEMTKVEKKVEKNNPTKIETRSSIKRNLQKIAKPNLEIAANKFSKSISKLDKTPKIEN